MPASSGDKLTRVAIVNADRCKPTKCNQECKKSCPVVRLGKQCIVVSRTSKNSQISEALCIGCGICVKKCPFDAISIINLPKNLEKETTHRYGPNTFKLHRLPTPRPGQVLGLVGENGAGKSTALKILAGKLKPNLGQFKSPPDWQEVLGYFRGSELQNYFTKILEDNLKAMIKPQYVDHIPRAVKGKVYEILSKKARDQKTLDALLKELDLVHLKDRDLSVLSGGELQRFAICIVAVQTSDVYMFDEPSSFLDIRQRLKAANVIRDLVEEKNGGGNKYVIVVEHDLALLDYLSDYVCMLYGTPGAYGVVTMPFAVRDGINIFLSGFIPTENLRFRDDELSFKVSQQNEETGGGDDGLQTKHMTKTYPNMSKTYNGFKLNVEAGGFRDSEIVVLLGENGSGKTTFIRMLAGLLQPDENGEEKLPPLNISYKPQKIAPKFKGTVRMLLDKRIKSSINHPTFQTDVAKPLQIEPLLDQQVQNLSGGELQRVALVLALGKPADVYLIDEPSAYLDSAQRIHAAKVIRRYILHTKKTAFVVEHDFIMATYLADKVVVYEGKPGVETTAKSPESLHSGMNKFLKSLNISLRRDDQSHRPRINKRGSQKDQEQKKKGEYFFLSEK
eukprot:maker-scaffold_6-snap-gene-17.28-mRNA-1 protein AED:0.13 eAED:0.13 QI:171/1/1/1/1/1/5/227/618